MLWYKWKWWRFALVVKDAKGAVEITDAAGTWKHLFGRLFFRVAR